MTLALKADLAQILAEVFLEPGADLREDLGQLLDSGPGPSLEDPLGRMARNALEPTAQSVEYTRLFLHAKDTDAIHLFESVQARGHHMAPMVIAPLQAIYDAADIHLQEDLGIPPDHLGLEFACLSYLLGQVIEGGLAERPRFVELAQRLLREHLRPLASAVAGQLPQVSAHPYYQAASDLASALLPETEKALAEL
ncbi:MAG: molecular chaperone TorD family protein [Geothrix sp.]|nr:molecular chaperone TorD family protein [Geothrix sp.]